MKQLRIYVEGKGDLIFIGHLIAEQFNINITTDLNKLKGVYSNEVYEIEIHTFSPNTGQGGISNKSLRSLVDTIIKPNNELGLENVLILDTDTPNHKNPAGGYVERKSYLDQLLNGLDVKYFLIPNNSDDGNLESLLTECISDGGKQFYSCLSSYVSCLEQIAENKPKGIREIECFDKTKLDWYTYMMLGKVNNKEGRDYLKQDLWDLDRPCLDKLKEFLNETLSP
ncbi:hypothetical protein EPD60_07105 [Flaviaesturariibacter flavus]|uniref:DUF4276 family protein n=1 Tax=Flaviaesturariibacter flavus TaxID=2502780 RepID=A0A4V2NWF0_9BACT|nr:DUF3226 domain-containing protein [Flaviaesturariibacter flavus]TCJ17072.1 hypothetical protein EPD60_07105 [Flaviaesturariibacter flavus]